MAIIILDVPSNLKSQMEKKHRQKRRAGIRLLDLGLTLNAGKGLEPLTLNREVRAEVGCEVGTSAGRYRGTRQPIQGYIGKRWAGSICPNWLRHASLAPLTRQR